MKIIIFFLISSFALGSQAECVNIYYDRGPGTDYWMGKAYSTFVQNLVAHFPHLDQKLGAIEDYQTGQIEECKATIYIGSYFENKIPQAFYDDFMMTKKNVAWLGYSIWKLGATNLENAFGMKYEYLTTLDTTNLDVIGQPGFFKFVHYKGEVFDKFGEFTNTDPPQFLAAFEQVALKETKPGISEWIATSRHSSTQEALPYIIRSKNKFYIADIPFSFMHESDRYMVFADLIFDILDEPPRHKKRYAFVRIEDVHPETPLPYLYDIQNVLKEESVPIHISLIPIFFDPLYQSERSPDEEFVVMDRHRAFMQWIREAQADQTRFIWHGVTHQLGRIRNPHDGMSGSDFEFWNANSGRPLDFDSARWVLDRMLEGIFTLEKAKIEFIAWLTPHYQASSLDYIIFGKIFQWNVGRVIYFNHSATPLAAVKNESDLWIKNAKLNEHQRRLSYFEKLKVTVESDRWSGQIFPYEIYGDVHGQRLLPENLGNSQPFKNNHVIRTRSVQQIVRDAKRNLVIRDAWASFFYHPFLFDSFLNGGRGYYPGDPTELKYLLKEIKNLGYEFIDLKQFIKTETLPKRRATLERKSL